MRVYLLVAVLFFPWAVALAGQSDAPANYLAGLDGLLAGKGADAAAAFGKAVDADEENADYRMARGVALVMTEQFPVAIKELERSLRLRGEDWETKLWLGAAYRMGGDAGKGANYIVHGPPRAEKADLDYSNFVYTMSQNYWSAGKNGQVRDAKTGKMLTTREIAATSLAKAAAMFAQRRRGAAPQQLAGQLLERVKADMRGGEYAAALRDLESLLAVSPEDDQLLLLRAEAELGLGDYISSRSDFTRVLIDDPLQDSVYAERDKAKAGLIELKHNKSETNQYKVAEATLRLVMEINAHRLYYDEIYQVQLRKLSEAVHSDPKNAGKLADLADFLFRESDVPFEQVEPRLWPVYYRYVPQSVSQYGRNGEILAPPAEQRATREVDRAEQTADSALALDANDVKSLKVKAAILNWRGKYQDARPLLEKAISVKADDHELLWLMSQTLEGIAHQDMAEAASLRAIKTSEGPHRADGTYTITTISPSPVDLARANELEKEAGELRKKAGEDSNKAIELTSGTAQSFYYQGLIQQAAGHAQEAKTAFEQAVKLDSKFRDAWDHLAGVLMELGPPEEWAAARSWGLNLIQTTAAPWLIVARQDILKTKFKSARDALANARRLDPADARIEAYRAIVEAEDGKPDDALLHYRQAIALEEARGLLHGRNLGAPGPLALRAEDVGLTLALRNRAGALLFQAGQLDAAAQEFQANLAFLSLVPSEKLAMPVPQANLPGSAADTAIAPPSETYASLKIRAQAGVDYTAWAKRYNDPKDTALAWQTYNRLAVQFQVSDPKPDVIQAVIDLGLAELQVSKGNFAQAKELLRNEGATPQALWQEMRNVEQQANGARRN